MRGWKPVSLCIQQKITCPEKIVQFPDAQRTPRLPPGDQQGTLVKHFSNDTVLNVNHTPKSAWEGRDSQDQRRFLCSIIIYQESLGQQWTLHQPRCQTDSR